MNEPIITSNIIVNPAFVTVNVYFDDIDDLPRTVYLKWQREAKRIVDNIAKQMSRMLGDAGYRGKLQATRVMDKSRMVTSGYVFDLVLVRSEMMEVDWMTEGLQKALSRNMDKFRVEMKSMTSNRFAKVSEKVASVSRLCEIFKARNGNWYMFLTDREYDYDQSNATAYGPFPSKEDAHEYLDRFANPGGMTYDNRGVEPVPHRSPNGSPVRKPTQKHWLYGMTAGTWSNPDTSTKANRLIHLWRLMKSGRWPTGVEGPVNGILYSLIGDDDLYDRLDSAWNFYLKDGAQRGYLAECASLIENKIMKWAKDGKSSWKHPDAYRYIIEIAKKMGKRV